MRSVLSGMISNAARRIINSAASVEIKLQEKAVSSTAVLRNLF